MPDPKPDPNEMIDVRLRVPRWLARPIEEAVNTIEAATTIHPLPAEITSAHVAVVYSAGPRYQPSINLTSGGDVPIGDAVRSVAALEGACRAKAEANIRAAIKQASERPEADQEDLAELSARLTGIYHYAASFAYKSVRDGTLQCDDAARIGQEASKLGFRAKPGEKP